MTPPGHPNTTRSIVRSESAISVKQYAEQQGITVQAAYKRLHAGQLGDGVIRRGSRYLIDPRRADAAWAQHGRPCNSRAAQLEQRLMLLPDQLADELAGEDATYVRVALTRAVLGLLDST